MSTWYQTRTLVAALALAVAFSAHAAEHMFRERRVDGVIALPFARLEDSPFDEPAGSAFPLATIDLGTGQPCPFVAMDVRPGLAAAVAHLRERGHRRLMWLTPRLGRAAPSADRLIALRTAVRDANMQVCAIPLTVASETVCGNYDDNQPQVLEAIRRKLPRPLEATAVLCWNDYLAHCLCAVLRERGLRIRDRFRRRAPDVPRAAVEHGQRRIPPARRRGRATRAAHGARRTAAGGGP